MVGNCKKCVICSGAVWSLPVCLLVKMAQNELLLSKKTKFIFSSLNNLYLVVLCFL